MYILLCMLILRENFGSVVQKISFVAHGLHFNKLKIKHEAEKYFGSEYNLSFHITTSNKEAEDLSESAILAGTDYLIAVGGDGTMSEVVNGVMRAPKEKRSNSVIGLLPAGSGNDFARTMHLTSKVSSLHKLIKENRIKPIDVGRLELKTMAGTDRICYFINIADVGLGAEVAKRVNEGHKTYGANIAFFAATLFGFLNYQRKKIKVESQDFNWSGNVLVLALANAKYFGSGLGIAPHAKIDDGKFSITLASDVSLIDYLKQLPKIRKGEMLNHPYVIYHETQKLIIEPIGKECLIEADGEMIGKLPLKAEMLKHELRFLSEV